MARRAKTFEERKKELEEEKAKLEEKKAKLKKQGDEIKSKEKALKKEEKNTSSKIDKRKKILIGAMVLYAIKENSIAQNWLNDRMDKFLSRTDERALFGLEPIAEVLKEEEERKAKRADLMEKKKAMEKIRNQQLDEMDKELEREEEEEKKQEEA